jgi:hypothetical protein
MRVPEKNVESLLLYCNILGWHEAYGFVDRAKNGSAYGFVDRAKNGSEAGAAS